MGLRPFDMAVLRCNMLPLIRNRVSYCRGFGRKFSVRTSQNPFLRISDEIQEAIHSNKPVVALETTIYTHGFPYPDNTALASRLESLVRLNGGVPATIGVLNGAACVGLSAEEIIELTASAGKPETRKLSRRDLGYICGLGMTGMRLNGGTTIAGTMVLAHLAGIRIFATGGLGGVHRGGESSMDISADLTELGRTPVTVISSGCKSFLDIPRTLEYLETQGVGVGTFADGREGKVDIPAFWTRESGIQSPTVIRDEREAAAIIFAQSSIGLSSGLHFANPISPEHSIPKAQIDSIMEQAILDAERSGSTGSDNTPFILAKIRELTGGRTVTANRALIESNVIRGTKVACELAKLEAQSGRSLDRIYPSIESAGPVTEKSEAQNTAQTLPDVHKHPVTPTDVFVAGSLALDLSCDYTPVEGSSTSISPISHTSNPARISQGLGGVGRNIATALRYVGARVRLCSATGDDAAGIAARNMLAAQGLSLAGVIKKPSTQTAQYVAVNNAHKDLVLAMADMSVMEKCKSEVDTIWKNSLEESKPRWLVVDANWDPDTLQRWIMHGRSVNARIAFEPVSVDKSRRLFASDSSDDLNLGVLPDHAISLASPNRLELASMHAAAREAGIFDRDDWWQVIDAMGLSSSGSRDKLISMVGAKLVDEGVPQQSIQLLPLIPTILTKLGDKGVLITQMLRRGDDRLTAPGHSRYVLSRADPNDEILGGIYMRLLAPAQKISASDVISVNGAGDTFLGIVIAGLAKDKSKSLIDLIDTAQQGSRMTLRSNEAVSPEISTLMDQL
ncbi:MAG: hypothetical protein Q9202_000684 [Teloschistes flavicans]